MFVQKLIAIVETMRGDLTLASPLVGSSALRLPLLFRLIWPDEFVRLAGEAGFIVPAAGTASGQGRSVHDDQAVDPH